MADDDPCPLKAGGDAPPELVRALRALSGPDTDADRLARVAKRLGAAIGDMPPGATGRLANLKTWLTSLVVGIAALGLGYYLVSSRSAPTPPVRRAAAPAAPATVAVETREALTVREVPAAAAPAIEVAVQVATPEREPPLRVHRRPTRAKPQPVAFEPPAATAPAATAPAAPAAPAATEASAALAAHPPAPSAEESVPAPTRAAAESGAVAERPKPQPVLEPAEPPAPRRTELELLLEAREVIRTQPSAALRLLDEHAAEYPTGLLGPEREVLAIEALRSVGRGTDAAKRLQRFQSRYPDSIHLRRLHGEAAR